MSQAPFQTAYVHYRINVLAMSQAPFQMAYVHYRINVLAMSQAPFQTAYVHYRINVHKAFMSGHIIRMRKLRSNKIKLLDQPLIITKH